MSKGHERAKWAWERGDQQPMKTLLKTRRKRNIDIAEYEDMVVRFVPEARAVFQKLDALDVQPEQLTMEDTGTNGNGSVDMAEQIIRIVAANPGMRQAQVVNAVLAAEGLDAALDDNRRKPYGKLKTLIEQGRLAVDARQRVWYV